MAKVTYDTFKETINAALVKYDDKLSQFEDTLCIPPAIVVKHESIPNGYSLVEAACPFCGKIHTITNARVFSCCGTFFSSRSNCRDSTLYASYAACLPIDGGKVVLLICSQKHIEYNTNNIVSTVDRQRTVSAVYVVTDDTNRHLYVTKRGVLTKTSANISKTFMGTSHLCVFDVSEIDGVQTQGHSDVFTFISALKLQIPQRPTPAKKVVTFSPSKMEAKDLFEFLFNVTKVDSLAGTMDTQVLCTKCGHLSDQTFSPEKDYKCLVKCSKCGREKDVSYCHIPSAQHASVLEIQETENSYIGLFSYCSVDSTWSLAQHCTNAFTVSKNNGKVQTYLCEGTEWSPSTKKVYIHNPRIVFPNSLKFAGLEKLTSPELSVYAKYIAIYFQNHIVEQVVKRNRWLAAILQDYLCGHNYASSNFNFNAPTVAEFFCISEPILKWYLKQTHYFPLADLQLLFSTDNKIATQTLDWIAMHQIHAGSLVSLMQFDLSLKQICEYLERVRVYQCCEPRCAVHDWYDYLSACKYIGMDLSDRRVRYPSALRTEHDKVVFKRSLILSKDKNGAFKQVVSQYAKLFQYEDKNIVVRAPSSLEELFEEGRKLYHCVGSYADRVLKGSCLILFVRKREEPDKPLLTMVVDPAGRCTQVRGAFNRKATPTEKKYLSAWANAKNVSASGWF